MALNKQTIAIIIILIVGISLDAIYHFLMANVNWKGTEKTKKGLKTFFMSCIVLLILSAVLLIF